MSLDTTLPILALFHYVCYYSLLICCSKGTKFSLHGIRALGFDLDILFKNITESFLFVNDFMLLIHWLILKRLLVCKTSEDGFQDQTNCFVKFELCLQSRSMWWLGNFYHRRKERWGCRGYYKLHAWNRLSFWSLE